MELLSCFIAVPAWVSFKDPVEVVGADEFRVILAPVSLEDECSLPVSAITRLGVNGSQLARCSCSSLISPGFTW